MIKLSTSLIYKSGSSQERGMILSQAIEAAKEIGEISQVSSFLGDLLKGNKQPAIILNTVEGGTSIADFTTDQLDEFRGNADPDFISFMDENYGDVLVLIKSNNNDPKDRVLHVMKYSTDFCDSVGVLAEFNAYHHMNS
jgi:hypothetical protein